MTDNTKIIDNIEKTKEFYDKYAIDFSSTRDRPWTGWKRIVNIIKSRFKIKKVEICDLGCGNGRFYSYLKQTEDLKFDYFGYDSSKKLLAVARRLYPLVKFYEHDAILNLHKMNKHFDVTVAFGLTHHIPKAHILEWLVEVQKILGKRGILVLSFWQTKKIEPGEAAYLGWREDPNQRYTHRYSIEEIKELIEMANLDLVIPIFNEDDNLYTVLQRKIKI